MKPTSKRQTRVSRTRASYPVSEGRGALMFGRCFMFQMFQSARFCTCSGGAVRLAREEALSDRHQRVVT